MYYFHLKCKFNIISVFVDLNVKTLKSANKINI